LGITQEEPRQARLQTVALARASQGKGYALEAVEAVLGFCFEKINLHRVFSACDHRDAAGLRLLDRLGLRREGEFVKDRWVGDDWANTVWFAALREEYRKAGEADTGEKK
jgi:aminoglycoside 6'-N-acetyltransferase